MRIEARARTMHGRRVTGHATTTLGFAVTRIATVRIITLPPLRRKARLHHQFEKVRSKRPPLRQVQDRMDHPLCIARLLEIREAERPGGVLGIDHVAYTKGDRLAPNNDLIPDVGSNRAGLVLPQ